jgi:hypothetical protein
MSAEANAILSSLPVSTVGERLIAYTLSLPREEERIYVRTYVEARLSPESRQAFISQLDIATQASARTRIRDPVRPAGA